MAKIKSTLENKLLNQKIENIRQKIENNLSYPEILGEKYTEKRNKKLQELKDQHQSYLIELESKTLSKDDYLKTFSKEEIDKLDHWFYWKKRAIDQTLKRQTKKHPDQKEQFKQKHQENLEFLSQKYNENKEKIFNKYTIEGYSDQEIEENRKFFETEKQRLALKYQTYEQQLIKEDHEKLSKQQEKINKANELLNQKLIQTIEKKKDLQKDLPLLEMDDDVILKLEGLTMKFGGLIAVNELSFDVKKGEIFGLIGPNGAGKTTVFNCITQFYKQTGGRMLYRDKTNDVVDLSQYQVHDVIKHGIVRTFQNVELIWELSILDNLLVASHRQYQTGFFGHLVHNPRFKREDEILKAKAIKILTDLELIAYKDFYPIGLPYGVLKLIELARTLMSNPNLIILDEPAAGLNDLESQKLVKTIRKIQKEYDCTIFLVEHDMGLVMELCDTICAISFGKKLAIGTPKEIKTNPVVQEAYLGGE
ncbi:MAG: ATP-binding cassette domain-containing protein [Tenericutes bacterium]|nr:ATP-binding cassette domain-containing protein [Mycoplasmatota bacterium]